jgi:hypothetical protein
MVTQNPDTGISITKEQFEALQKAYEAGDYTQYHYLKSLYGSPLPEIHPTV